MSDDRRVRREAADLLACLASQPGTIHPPEISASIDGAWSPSVRRLAAVTWQTVYDYLDDWRENYAEAEARLREAIDA